MDFLNNLKEQSLLIIPNNLKTKVLEEINKQERLINVKILTFNEFNKHYFFDYNQETIYYLVKNYNLSVENAIIFLNNLIYIEDYNSNHPNILYLKKIYQDLTSHDLLIFDPLFKKYLQDINLIILKTKEIEPFYVKIFSLYNPTYYSLELKDLNLEIPIYHFKGIEEEVSFIFNQISSLIKSGVNPQSIKLMNVTSEYYNFLKRFSYLYKIKINNINKTSIYGTVMVKNLLSLIKENKSKEEILDYLNHFQDKDIYFSIFNILNHYYFTNSFLEVYDLIVYELKNTYLLEPIYNEGIEIINLDDSYITNDNYIFLLGFNLENIPNTYKDIDYLNDNIKQEIGLFTSLEKNKLTHQEVLKQIKSLNNLIITYKDTDPYKSYYPSNLIEELNVKEIKDNISNLTSNLYNQIKLTNNFDLMLKYGTKLEDTDILNNTYPDLPYLTYDNTFTGLNNFYIPNINLSYTSLNNYYSCRFRYYIDNILKLNIYEDTFKIFIGNLFHYILSKIFENNFDFELEFTNYLKDKEFSTKELFYLEILKQELKDIIKIILKQHEYSGLNKLKLEQAINLEINDHNYFKGIIDKIMYKEKDNYTYISLIDYKTGTPKTDMSNLEYGIDMQLPIYAYLIKKSNLFLNPKIIGFYFQQILHEKANYDIKKDNESLKEDKLKLMGYSINDDYLVSMFDSTYENSKMIKSMKITSKGFSHYTKVLSEEAIDNLVKIVDLKIKEAFKEISKGNFSINPKVIANENIGCRFCSYQDLCFKTGKDLVYLEEKNDLTYLEGDDNNATLD